MRAGHLQQFDHAGIKYGMQQRRRVVEVKTHLMVIAIRRMSWAFFRLGGANTDAEAPKALSMRSLKEGCHMRGGQVSLGSVEPFGLAVQPRGRTRGSHFKRNLSSAS